jgi:hypothetical protein
MRGTDPIKSNWVYPTFLCKITYFPEAAEISTPPGNKIIFYFNYV